MAHTVKQVSDISGVSVRTLHFYDETGLLKPAYVGANGYRFYEQPQLLTLQQIMFYRELGLGLKQIKSILGHADFEKISALRSHHQALQDNLARTRRLIETIDKTLNHLEGSQNMNDEELFTGFTVAAGADRFGQTIMLGGPAGEPLDCKLSSHDTGGALCVLEFTCFAGGPKHLHYDQDEWIYVVDGEFEFHVGDKQLFLGPGESVFIPRNVSHVFAIIGDKRGKIINAYQPAGKMEEFFREIGKYDGNPAIHEVLGREGLHRLFGEYGMNLNGPPLHWDGPID